jgi:hypothetical protein
MALASHLSGGLDAAMGQGWIFVSTSWDRVEVLEDANVRAIAERGLL